MGVPPIISGTGKATNFKFGRYIYRVHPSKCALKKFQKRDIGRTQGLPQFFGVPTIISGTGKATDVKFGRYIDRVYVKPTGTVATWIVEQGILHFFRSPIHWAHRAVIFATAWLSC